MYFSYSFCKFLKVKIYFDTILCRYNFFVKNFRATSECTNEEREERQKLDRVAGADGAKAETTPVTRSGSHLSPEGPAQPQAVGEGVTNRSLPGGKAPLHTYIHTPHHQVLLFIFTSV